MSATANPLEQLVEDLAPEYVALVQELVPVFSPNRPWWTEALTQDQQLWRWVGTPQEPGPRLEIMGGVKLVGGPAIQDMKPEQVQGWLPQVAAALAQKRLAFPDLAKLIEFIFTSPAADKVIPLEILMDLPPELLEMVQAAGPIDAAKHIQKVEALYQKNLEGQALLATPDATGLPKPPSAPPALPGQLGTQPAGWPTYGGAPQAATSQFNPTPAGLSGQ